MHDDLVQLCVDHLRAAYDTISALDKDQENMDRIYQEANRMIRVMTVLEEYVAECDEAYGEERAILPLGRCVSVCVCVCVCMHACTCWCLCFTQGGTQSLSETDGAKHISVFRIFQMLISVAIRCSLAYLSYQAYKYVHKTTINILMFWCMSVILWSLISFGCF